MEWEQCSSCDHPPWVDVGSGLDKTVGHNPEGAWLDHIESVTISPSRPYIIQNIYRQGRYMRQYIYLIYSFIMTHSLGGILNSAFQVLDGNGQWTQQTVDPLQVPRQDMATYQDVQGGHHRITTSPTLTRRLWKTRVKTRRNICTKSCRANQPQI